MSFDVKKAVTPVIATVSVLAVVGVGWATIEPAWASKAISDTLIDKDLENALRNHFQKRFFNLIDATEEQKKELSAIIAAQAEEAGPIRQELRSEVLDINDLIADEGTTDEQIKQRVDKIRALRDKLQDKRLETMLKVRSKLSAEQKQIVSRRIKGILTGNPRLGLLGR
jgi:hypothetical protein